MSATTTVAGDRAGRRFRRRHLWIIPGLAIAIAANRLGEMNGVGILALIAFGLAPDVPRLFGSRGRPAHDLLHRPVVAGSGLAVAIVITASGVTAIAGIVALVAALVWVGHIVIGWGVGDVPRGPAGRADA
jgi:hypothetical protein